MSLSQETLYLYSLSLKCLCRFVSWWIFFFTLILPCVVVYGPHFSYIRFQLVCSTKLLAKSDPANICTSWLCRIIIYLPNCLKTIFYIIFFILIFFLEVCTIYFAQGGRKKLLLSKFSIKLDSYTVFATLSVKWA
jgi:hypothetical protein